MAFSRLIRNVVSKDSKRFVDGDYDLNLTYITPRIIAMGFPASGVEGMYRNSIVEVSQFLNERHGDHYMCWNLSGRDYDYSLFHNQILDFGFPDHHNPPLQLLFKIIHSMHSWLSADESNVAVVHCLAGKGRTGTVIACYLSYIGEIADPVKALKFYGEKRSHIAKGVSYPSQRRYVRYFDDVVSRRVPCQPSPLVLETVVVKGMPVMSATAGNNPSLQVCQSVCGQNEGDNLLHVAEQVLYSSAWLDVGRQYKETETELQFTVNVVVEGDIILRLFHVTWMLGREVMLLRTSFHTSFIPASRELVLKKKELDLADKDKRFGDDFSVTLKFKEDDGDIQGEARTAQRDPWDDEFYDRFISVAEEERAKRMAKANANAPQRQQESKREAVEESASGAKVESGNVAAMADVSAAEEAVATVATPPTSFP
eukprot:CAMPEP_0114615288 /NCGR_PEP_ID=MMETSP0168-20121206/6089_1 /TAXON_ID=95228 ORGANISM="Vannella sp., Strain DIVA3 517/6/12" /NCGR_SAMPLE_ID=MMETSP0168 /ASSEMBLY_ACC=CAM_ASM_000044 /LENGTH=426 /DNA_ID=CAMNT_0001826357 /DNA_START=74 /DNA_END=1354 /DNA_ORIENTATION=+